MLIIMIIQSRRKLNINGSRKFLNVKSFFLGKYNGVINDMYSWVKIIKIKFWTVSYFSTRVESHTIRMTIPMLNHLR